ncbi:MAG: hypothetical protein KME23_08155 [Goleter apudmare HA4340-LM2]|jgi:hypothetical protein|nr:hypothetical protein [Goleter apudmare HA4340-LM2]
MESINQIFTEITSEEAASVTGGLRVSFDWDTYFFILGVGVLLGNPGLTPEEIQFAWESAFVFESRSRPQQRRGQQRFNRGRFF